MNLAPDGLEEDDWVTRVVPSVRVGFQGTGLQIELNYALEVLLYASDSERNGAFNQLDGDALIDLIGDDLQFRARGTMTQVNISPGEPVATSNLNVTGNRTDENSWDVGPEWNTPVFSGSEFDGHFWAGRVYYDDTPRTDEGTDPVTVPIQDITTMEGIASIHSADDSNRPLTYDLGYEIDRLEYDISGVAKQQAAYLRLGYRVTPEFEVFGLGGLDSDFADIADASLTEDRWEVGFAAGSAMYRVEAAVGDRYFGTTWRVALLRESDKATYSLTYDESPTTNDLAQIRQLPAGIPGDEDIPEAPPDPGIDQPGTPTRYLEKRGDASGIWRFYRSTLSISLFWEQRSNQIEVDPDSVATSARDDESSYGTTVSLDWEVGPRSILGAAASWSQREFVDASVEDDPFTDRDQISNLTLTFDRELGLRTNLAFRMGFQSRAGAAGGADYDEYWAGIELGRTF